MKLFCGPSRSWHGIIVIFKGCVVVITRCKSKIWSEYGQDSAGYSNLGIRIRKTTISIDAIPLIVKQVHWVLLEVFLVLVDLINAV